LPAQKSLEGIRKIVPPAAPQPVVVTWVSRIDQYYVFDLPAKAMNQQANYPSGLNCVAG